MGKIIWELEEDENALIALFYYFCGHSQSSKRAPLNEAAGILHSHKQWEISAEPAVGAVKSAAIHSSRIMHTSNTHSSLGRKCETC